MPPQPSSRDQARREPIAIIGIGCRFPGDANDVAARADVTSAQQVADVLADIGRTLPPLRGIFHAAMVWDDGILSQLGRDRFRNVMAPKVDGTWNLHAQTATTPLDFFVLFSSMASWVGNPGQRNYAAANAFLDAFAHYRRSLGLEAITINWGHVTGEGTWLGIRR